MNPSAGLSQPRQVVLPAPAIETALRDGQRALLRGLLTVGAGFLSKAAAPLRSRPGQSARGLFLFCVKGAGWCEIGGRLHTVRAGDLLALPPGTPYLCRAHLSEAWAVHWAEAVGDHLGAYLQELAVSAQNPVVRIGEDLQVARLFDEVLKCLEHGNGFVHLLQASQALAHLLALAIRHQREREPESPDSVQKVAQSIIYMSEHLDQPLRVTELAELANLSPAHFSVLFKEQSGCSPRDYLHLLRIHKACQLLRSSALNVKEIAARLGYQDQFHFSRQFKAFQGLSPTQYRGQV